MDEGENDAEGQNRASQMENDKKEGKIMVHTPH